MTDETQDTILTFLKEEFRDLKQSNSQEHEKILEKGASKDDTIKQQIQIDNHCSRIRGLEAINATLLTRDKFDILIKSNQGELAVQREKIRDIQGNLIELEPVKRAYDKLAALAVGFIIMVGIIAISAVYFLKDLIKKP